jgi:prepilin-type processing-associated H-X9-DG protein
MRHIAGWLTARRAQRDQFRFLVLGMALSFVILAQGLCGQEVSPRSGGAPLAANSLARYVPRRGLAFYLEFDGLDVHAADWHASAACKLLVDTKLGGLLEDLSVQALDLVQSSLPQFRRTKGADLVEGIKSVARRGFVMAFARRGPTDSNFLVVLRGGDRPEVHQLVESLASGVTKEGASDQIKKEPARADRGGRTCHPLTKELVWWAERGDLVLAAANWADEIMAVIDGKEQSAVEHPLRTELKKRDGDFTHVAVGFVDMKELAPLPAESVQLGFDTVQRIDLRWGFQDRALATVIRVLAREPRRGLLSLLDQRPFGKGSLPPLPANVTSFAVLSVDGARAVDQLDRILTPKSGGGGAFPPAPADRGMAPWKHLFAQLGPTIAFYTQAPERPDTQIVAGMIVDRLAGWTLSAPVRDEAAVAAAIDPLFAMVSQSLKRQLRQAQNRGLIGPVWSIDVRATAEPRGYTLDYVNSQPVVLAKLRPTVAVSRGQLVFAGSPAAVERALAAGPEWQPAGDFVPVVNRLPAKMIYLSIQDPRVFAPIVLKAIPILVRQLNAELAVSERRAGKTTAEPPLRLETEMIPASDDLNRLLFPSSTALHVDQEGATLIHREAFPSLTSPASAATMVALVLPSIQSAREAAMRVQCINNLKMIALAMHNYHSTNNAFPRPAITDAKGKPLLSWRVTILPFLDQQALYNRFKLDEPWDSPHNKELLKEMPATYLCPQRGHVEPSTTTYRVVTGNGALFEKDQDISVAGVTDGTSNTMMIVECETAVPWTKPDDIAFDPAAAPSLLGAGSPHPGGFNVSFADGAVRFISSKVDLNVFRALITRAAGEVINAGAF